MSRTISEIVLVCAFLLNISMSLKGQGVDSLEVRRTDMYAAQLENYLREYLVDKYEERSNKLWYRDYSSIDAFIRSIEPNRARWRDVVIKPPEFRKTAELQRKFHIIEGVKGEWLELELGALSVQAFYALPQSASNNQPVPLVICQHGIGSSPETPFKDGGYHAYAKALLEAGFAVLVPMNLRSIERRNRIERLARMANLSLPGIEFARLQHLLDEIVLDDRIDSERIGMWGVSLGGMATMFFMPLEQRIKVGVVSGWFNERRNKMVIKDERYSCFLETREDHAFFNGWLTEFSDYDAVSLITPRPLLIQHGKQDGIAYWPQVVNEFNKAKIYYDKLGVGSRIKLDMHEGGHEAIVESGLQFMKKWLLQNQ
ncbi:hypothetical protein D1164_14055 [Mariniphaga sediminis]|uniref:Peptidase S9 prolyl oligopeptidase catalytic domain-containing protein n=1 Tax=Mariniphaga sediminis TaxID=1628158 RepID=A0A399CYG7_9BACT|nr:prolyl oligopeptidase family serine peptidase [Mariniphaga sediminis]RIH64479.1 hypothetical protein D1164_14055 [Mariniphaga sediminis]